MADNKQPIGRRANKLLAQLSGQEQDIYKTTYHSSDINNQIFTKMSDELSDSIHKAIQTDGNYADLSNTTKLWQNLRTKIGSKGINGMTTSPVFGDSRVSNDEGNMMELFQDPQLLASLSDTYASNRWIKLIKDEIDMVLKYMPKLQTALNIKKQNVLCADNYTKSFLNISLENSLKPDSDENFVNNKDYILKEYNFEKRCEEWYDEAAQYGESFIYCVPYKKAFKELLARKKNTNYIMKESLIMENGILKDNNKLSVKSKVSFDGTKGSITLKMNRTGLLSETIEGIHKATGLLQENMYTSIYDTMLQENTANITNEATTDKTVKFNQTVGDELSYEDEDRVAADGLIGANKGEKNANIKTPGCVLKTLEQEHLIPLYIEDFCLGYYYFNVKVLENNTDINSSVVQNNSDGMTRLFGNGENQLSDPNGDLMLRNIAGKISQNIDSTFINNNQDLRNEIYMMLKYNDQYNQLSDALDVNVTFIPPEDIVHLKFNEDPKTHRGRSDIWAGLIAAKMWIMINSTCVIGQVTRGQDKRVYYVKTMVDTNVATTLLNVVNQIKKGNFGMRQMESINNILGLVGKFNDFVIPVGPSGDSPINFDIMQGQQFEMPVELMNNLEDSAVSSIVPLEIVNSSMGMDFAIRYTMTNSRLLKDVMDRQNECNPIFSKIFTKIYNCEFEDNARAKVELSIPMFLMITQGSQTIQTTTQYIDAIAEVEMASRPDEDRILFKKLMLEQMLPSYINVAVIQKILDDIEIQKSLDKNKKDIEGGEEGV